MGRGSLGQGSMFVNRGSLISNVSSVGKPSTSTLASMAAGLLSETTSLKDLGRETNNSQNSNSAPTITTTSFSYPSNNSGSIVSTSSGNKRSKGKSEPVMQRVRIVDPGQVYDAINLGRRIDVQWPDETMRQKGGKSHWQDWLPEKGMEGPVVHRWVPCHKDPGRRSHVDRTIILVKIEDKYVPIAESGLQDLGAEV